MRELPFKIFSQIAMKLNVQREWTFDDWRMVAEELGVNKDTTELLASQKNPFHDLFTQFCTDVTVLKLINILHKINHLDAAAILEEWIQGAQ